MDQARAVFEDYQYLFANYQELMEKKRESTVPDHLLENLSEREKRCYFLYLEGNSYQEISNEMNVAKSTVKIYMKHIREKTQPDFSKVKSHVEKFPKILEKKQTLHDRLMNASGIAF